MVKDVQWWGKGFKSKTKISQNCLLRYINCEGKVNGGNLKLTPSNKIRYENSSLTLNRRFDNLELAERQNSVEVLLEDEEIRKFCKWANKQRPQRKWECDDDSWKEWHTWQICFDQITFLHVIYKMNKYWKKLMPWQI